MVLELKGRIDRVAELRHAKAVVRGTAMTPAGPVIEHLTKLYRSGHSPFSVSQRSEIPDSTLTSLINAKDCTLFVAESLLAVQPLAGREYADGGLVSPVAARRMVEAAAYDGIPGAAVAKRAGMSNQQLDKAVSLAQRIKAQTERAIWEAVEELLGTPVEERGVPLQSRTRTLNWARRQQFAAAICWDDDTIRDPGAIPNWTGQCGTLNGYQLHRDTGEKRFVKFNANGSQKAMIACEACRLVVAAENRKIKWERNLLASYGITRRAGRVQDYETAKLITKILAENPYPYGVAQPTQ